MSVFDPATLQGQVMRGDWLVFIAASVAVGVVVYAFILAPLVLWRRRSEALPPQFASNAPLEIGGVVVSLLLVAGLFYVTYRREMPVDAVSAHPFQVIDVTGFRWSWEFDYPSGIHIVGTPQRPPELVLPEGEQTQIMLHSVDVNHSFWVPAFLFKRDAIPGMVNRFDLTPVKIGRFTGRCTQFCGLDHALMTFTVRVVPLPAYRAWVAAGGRSPS
ncbi:MAG TPA: cytochrome c oxidase subunit II [Candidatus Tumulicola sp.]|jgi:cytochrome c oxidase subunit 2